MIINDNNNRTQFHDSLNVSSLIWRKLSGTVLGNSTCGTICTVTYFAFMGVSQFIVYDFPSAPGPSNLPHNGFTSIGFGFGGLISVIPAWTSIFASRHPLLSALFTIVTLEIVFSLPSLTWSQGYLSDSEWKRPFSAFEILPSIAKCGPFDSMDL